MKANKFKFIFIFFILSFILIGNVKANYKATVLNPQGASCSLRKGSTGYCLYSDESLSKPKSPVIWLDTGDEVTVIEGVPHIPTNNTNICSDYYVYVSHKFYLDNKDYEGYYCNANLSTGNLTENLKQEFRNAGFPESYWGKLAILKTTHPNWSFKAINTGLSFNEVVSNETYANRSLLRRSMSNNYAYLSLDSDSFNYKGDYFIAYDDTTGSDPWYKANYGAIAYYVDPRNFLSDMYIFQFETISYDDSVSDDDLKNSIAGIFGDDYLKTYIDDFLEAGKYSKVNPIYLASLSFREVSNGAYPGSAINGKYNGKYNFYNIGAYSGANPQYNGLDFAAKTDESTLRPWDDEEKAIKGGAKWIYDNYVAEGQDTSYFKKFDVIYNYLVSQGRTPSHSNYTHQYMQNIKSPSDDGVTTYRSYSNNGMLSLSYTFFIPVYSDMPEATSLPTGGGWPNNYLKSMSLNDSNVVDFNGDITTYNYNLDINNPTIKIGATAVSSTAKIDGTGTFTITSDTTKTIKVTAQNGSVRNYNINIKLTGTKLEDPVDIKTTLNNAGIKNNDKYLSGITVSSDISQIKEKIQNIRSDAVVTLKNSSGNVKNSGVVATGDRITITLNGETKTFEIVIYGDVNGDGKIAATDYVKIKNKIMGTSSLSGVYSEAADVDRNGKVAATDYVKIKNDIMGSAKIVQ